MKFIKGARLARLTCVNSACYCRECWEHGDIPVHEEYTESLDDWSPNDFHVSVHRCDACGKSLVER